MVLKNVSTENNEGNLLIENLLKVTTAAISVRVFYLFNFFLIRYLLAQT
jgi:hypothetical protein